MSKAIHFYGEKGLVIAALLDLEQQGKLLEFLRSIEFPYRTPTNIEIQDSSEVKVIVEAGFFQFGKPDALITISQSEDDSAGKRKRYLFIIEAKDETYLESASHFTARDKKFNSRINGEFTLRYRLARALQHYTNGQAALAEPEELACAYGSTSPCHLAKSDNLINIVEPYLIGIPFDCCLFVALTDDEESPWETVRTSHPTKLPYVRNALMQGDPPDPWPSTKNEWEEYKGQFGWIGFNSVETLVGKDGFLDVASHFLKNTRFLRRRGKGGITPGDVPTFKLKNWKACEAATNQLRDRLRCIIKHRIEGTRSDLETHHEGSDTLLDAKGTRVLKLLPPTHPEKFPGDTLYVGIRSPDKLLESRNELSERLKPFSVQGKVFYLIGVNSGKLGDPEWDTVVSDLVSCALGERG